MNLSKKRLGELIQLIAWCAALASVFGWFPCLLFWLNGESPDVALARLRADPEFEPMVRIWAGLLYLAPPALILGIVALPWRSRYMAETAIVLGAVGTGWLAFGP